MENFAGTGVPGNPLTGQLWYDSSEARLKLYDGTTFRTAGGPIVSNTRPNMVAGDILIDNENNKMYFYDGTDLVLVGQSMMQVKDKQDLKLHQLLIFLHVSVLYLKYGLVVHYLVLLQKKNLD